MFRANLRQPLILYKISAQIFFTSKPIGKKILGNRMINGIRYNPTIASQSFDAIVIGSGLGGLTCAALMAKAGKRVLVLERHYTAGGFTHSFKRRGYEWDVGVHYIGDVHKPYSPLSRVFDTITDSKLQWAKMDNNYDRMVYSDRSYNYIAGARNFRDELVKSFPCTGKQIDTYLQHMRAASRTVVSHFGQRLLPQLLQWPIEAASKRFSNDYFGRTTYDVMRTCIRNEKLASVLTGQWGDYGSPPKQSSFAMHALVAQHYLDGGNFPVGGASQIAKHIIPVIEASGGAVLVNAEVEQILLRKNSVVGVKMRNGDEIQCRHVISATGVHTTFSSLLPIQAAERDNMLERVSTLKRSVSHLGLYVGLKGSAQTLGLKQTNLWVYRDYDHDTAMQRFLAKVKPSMDFPLMYISFPSAKDPAWGDHHPDKSTIDVITPVPWAWFEKWHDLPWKNRGAAYDDYKQKLSEHLTEEIYRQVPQARGHIDYHELSTPLSTAHFSNYATGELYGLEHSPYRFAQRWLTPRTSIGGLYLTGQDILFCGVGSALISGVLTASALLGPKMLRILPDLLAGRSMALAGVLKQLTPKTPALPAKQSITNIDTQAPMQDIWFNTKCIEVKTLTDDCKTFRFHCDVAKMRKYRPGQFVTIQALIDGKKICRSYTMSSTPTRPDFFEITVKRVINGPFSNWICDSLKAGDTLKMSGPFGEFSCAPKPAKKILLLSAGSGITPMISMARWLADKKSNVDMIFLHAARKQSELIFGSEIKQLGKQHTGTKVKLLLSQEPADSNWRGSRGRLNLAILRRAVPDLPEREVYLCGPEPFMENAKQLLAQLNLPASQLHLESFDVTTSVSGSGGTVTFAVSNKEISIDGTQSLLEAAEAAGITIPSACRTGHCGECKVRCLSGDTSMSVRDGLSDQEITENYVLTCVGAANGDVSLAA